MPCCVSCSIFRGLFVISWIDRTFKLINMWAAIA